MSDLREKIISATKLLRPVFYGQLSDEEVDRYLDELVGIFQTETRKSLERVRLEKIEVDDRICLDAGSLEARVRDRDIGYNKAKSDSDKKIDAEVERLKD